MPPEHPPRLHTLPVDILIDLFKSLPNFNCLLPLLLAHSAFYEVWKANFNDISHAIARREFVPHADATNLMLEQRHPCVPRPSPLHFSPADLGQMHSNAQYVDRLLAKHRAAKAVWAGSTPPAETPSELLRFRRAAYRVWLFMLTIEIPRCEALCDELSLVDMVEMQVAAKHFGSPPLPPDWPGLPDFSLFPPGTAVVSLEGVMRRRITDYARREPDLDTDDVHDAKRYCVALGLLDPCAKDVSEKLDLLRAVERRWRLNNKQ